MRVLPYRSYTFIYLDFPTERNGVKRSTDEARR